MRMESEFDITCKFKEAIREKTFGFSNKHNSDGIDITRYRDGIRMISELTKKSIGDLEDLCHLEEDEEREITDARISVGNILFEYSFPLTEDVEFDEEGGWWKVFSLIGGKIGDIDKLENIKEEKMKKTIDLLYEIINLGFTQEDALAGIDAALDVELDERRELKEEWISEELYNDMLFGFICTKEGNE